MLDRRLLVRMDFVLLACVLVIVAYGALMIYSCTRADLEANRQDPYRKAKFQLIWVLLGLIAMAAMTLADYSQLSRFLTLVFVGNLLLLLLVLVAGKTVRGATRWIALGPMNFQPGELCKIAVIITLAVYLAGHEEEASDLRALAKSLAFIAAPAALILLQPDLGTPIVLFGIWVLVVFMWGGRASQIGAICFSAAVLSVAAWEFGLISPEQKQRLLAFMSPGLDPSGVGWHLTQAKAAIGAGGFLGQGFLHGSQTQLAFVPDQETDFIFTAVAEEWGFVGSIVLLGLFAVVMWRCLEIIRESKDMLGRLLAAGVTALFAIHLLVNIGMTMGLMPVKGMPLPFFSYGGSNLLTNMIALGLLQNVWMRRAKITF